MKRIVFFLFLVSCEFSSFALADEEPKSLDEIFTTFSDIVKDQQTDPSTFFRKWKNFEYFKFLVALNEAFQKREIITVSSLKMLIRSELTEIFGGIYFKDQFRNNVLIDRNVLNDRNVYFIPENLLDPRENIALEEAKKQENIALEEAKKQENIALEEAKKQENSKYSTNYFKHDGAIVEYKEQDDSVRIHNILEVKINGYTGYKKKQSHNLLIRWFNQGLYISDKLFVPNNVYIRASIYPISNDGNLKKKKIFVIDYNNVDYTDEVMLYDTGVFKKSTKMEYKLLTDVSNSINKILRKDDFKETLSKMNEAFIDRILYLFKKYIQIYGRIPSLSSKLGLCFSLEQKDSVHQKDRIYFENDDNRKDLIITLYSIYRNDTLFPIFKKRISEFFTPKEVERINLKIKEYDNFTSVDLLLPEKNTKKNTEDTLVELLGKENLDLIRETVNHCYMPTRNPEIDLKQKHDQLLSYFKTKVHGNIISDEKIKNNVNTIILSHLDGFITILPIELRFFLGNLEDLELSYNESYKIMRDFEIFNKFKFIKMSTQKIENLKELLNEFQFKGKIDTYNTLRFMFRKKLEEITDDVLVLKGAISELKDDDFNNIMHLFLTTNFEEDSSYNFIKKDIYFFREQYDQLKNSIKFTTDDDVYDEDKIEEDKIKDNDIINKDKTETNTSKTKNEEISCLDLFINHDFEN